MRVRKATFTRLDASAPWAWSSSGDPVVKFVLVVRGAGILTTASYPSPIPLRGGDVFIMLDASPYRMYDHEASLPMNCVEIEQLRVGHKIEVGGGGALTTFVSGFFELDRLEFSPLLNVLPRLLHLKLEQSRSLAFQSVLELLAAETEAPGLGSEAVISRLFELLFVHAIRAYSERPASPARGWLSGISDRQLARSIEGMHAEPAKNWTVGMLAREAGMSRSAFAARFRQIVGQTPLDYLRSWRVYRASRLLQRNSASLAEIAREVGYESTAAFNRIFKKATGETPGIFRTRASGAT